MMFKNKLRFAGVIALLGLFGFAGKVGARENVVSAQHKKEALRTAASSGCIAATYAIDMDINNVRARLMTGGDMWWNIGLGNAAYEIPKGSGKSSQFAASCWIGGYDKQGQLKVAAQTYRQDGNDYWPGPLDQTANITQSDCSEWDRFWKISRETVKKFRDLKDKSAAAVTSEYDVVLQWPAKG